jgi:outer membrane protein W
MIRIKRLFWLAVVTLLVTATAYAQEPSKVGITMAYPASFGIVWDASKAFAIRPAITFGGGSSNDAASIAESSNWNVGATISALFYMKKYDNVRTYVSPSYRYSHTSTKTTPSSSTQPGLPSVELTGNGNGASGTFGAEYAPTSRVRIYAEIGFAYVHAKNSVTITSFSNSTTNTWGTTAGVGFVFYP